MSSSIYISLYYNLILLLVICVYFLLFNSHSVAKPFVPNEFFSIILLLIIFIFITFRDSYSPLFGDTMRYAKNFELIKLYGSDALPTKDIGFQYLTLALSKIVNLRGYWFILCCFYVLPVYYAIKKQFPKQFFIAFLFFVCSFSFWTYGINGLRNGIATSLVFFSFLFLDSDVKRIPIWILAFLFHASALLPILCFLLAKYIANPKYYLLGWLLVLVLMLIARDSFSSLLMRIPWLQQDVRMTEYFSMSYNDLGGMFTHQGFRWDFVLYSIFPIISGIIYIYKLHIEDKLYIRLFNTYVAANAFWLLTIYIPFNNRFAYLSWFLYSILIIYPLLKKDLVKSQVSKIQYILLIYYAFTYVMWIKG